MLHLLLMMMATTALATSADFNCASKIVSEFQLELPFKPEVESLLKSAFPHKEQCAQFSAFFWQQLEQLSSIGQWSSRDASFRRRQAANVFLISHYRAARSELSNEKKTKMMYRIEHILKEAAFEEDLFMPVNAPLFSSSVPDEACADKVRSLLDVKKPLSSPLVAYLDGLKDNACKAFHGGLKLALSQMTNLTGTGDLVDQEEAMKEITVEAILRLLYTCAKSNRTKKNDDVAFGLCDDVFATELLLGDIFSTARGSNVSVAGNSSSLVTAKEGVEVSSSSYWNVIFWAVVIVTVLIALYFGLRFLDVIPDMA